MPYSLVPLFRFNLSGSANVCNDVSYPTRTLKPLGYIPLNLWKRNRNQGEKKNLEDSQESEVK